MGRLVAAALLLAACGGIVDRPLGTAPMDSGLETSELTVACEICVDPAERYCGGNGCFLGAHFCDLYGCFPCATCGGDFCAHARCLP